jgi:hypothetical protein
MATKVTRHQIQSLNPSQLTQQGAISGDTLIAVKNPLDNGLTLVWSPTSVLPRAASHGQILAYNSYTGTWAPTSINAVGGGSSLPTATGDEENEVLTWNGFEWVVAPSQGIKSVGIIVDSSLSVTSSVSNPLTSDGNFTIGLNDIALSKINRGAASPGQVLTWGTNTWTPSAVTNYVAGVRAWVVFDGTGASEVSGLPMYGQRNVTSVVDNDAGDYTINFAEGTFSSNAYAFCSGINKNQVGQYTSSVVQISSSATAFRVHTGFTLQSNIFNQFDASVVSLVFFA